MIYTECFADTVVVQKLKLNIDINEILKEDNVFKVVNKIDEFNQKKVILGFIDEDKSNKHNKLNNFEICYSNNQLYLKVLKHKSKEFNYLLIHKNLENWLYQFANNIDDKNFIERNSIIIDRLKTDPKHFKKSYIKNDILFKNFLNEMVQIKNSGLYHTSVIINKILENNIKELNK